jgi:hypothetical protein
MKRKFRVYYSGLWWKGLWAADGRTTGVDVEGAYVWAGSRVDVVVVVLRLTRYGCRVRGVFRW